MSTMETSLIDDPPAIVITIVGEADMAAILALLPAEIGEPRRSNVIWDLTDASLSTMSPGAVLDIAREAAAQSERRPEPRTVFITRDPIIGKMTGLLRENVARMGGTTRFRIAPDREIAIAWLRGDPGVVDTGTHIRPDT